MAKQVGAHLLARTTRRLIELGDVPPRAVCEQAVVMSEDDAEEMIRCVLALGYGMAKEKPMYSLHADDADNRLRVVDKAIQLMNDKIETELQGHLQIIGQPHGSIVDGTTVMGCTAADLFSSMRMFAAERPMLGGNTEACVTPWGILCRREVDGEEEYSMLKLDELRVIWDKGNAS